MEILTKRQRKSAKIVDGGKYYKATLVTPEDKVVIDEKGVLNVLTDVELERVTVRSLSTSRLDEEMADIRFSEKVMPFMSTKPSTPYIRLTEGAVDDDPDS